ncbi:MAG TPA: membrane protein insertion efficiency factor YidD [Eubacterium sp.]|nr:membrane protein insertion efficiency factor YidD [Eubacterium sp.]
MIRDIPKKISIKLVILYRRYISSMKPYGMCKYDPTCSAYSLEAFKEHGFIKGLILSMWRILRCNPFSKGGYDPVPKNIKIRRK